ncbi:DNA-binding GntR family transcriptional regulator [Janthinobacterium sp. CG_23.3]|uniref:GntR family transcriptional regulator n=1 Tax=unclassified Janthinobacterium TaxID=2610881 RepID=UPI000347B8B4|nr:MULTISPECIES: GntR family transcriptional regulator [unclassified Janthinobacterium]MEC5159418.1 DNA-binding GntR family transcriptional regulator [Janthinobacterium sp. CG_S6]
MANINAASEEKQSTGDSSNEIAHDIAEAIAARKLPPGTKLREEALCRLYSVSRTKIRAALLILSKDKLINIIPDKGAFVSQPSETESRDIFAARRIIETALAREFVAKAKPADYKMLERHLKAERNALSSDSTKVRSQLLGDFHVLLADVVGNQVLKEIVRELVGRSSLITMLYQSDRDAVCSSDEHTDFLEAAKAGDADKAAHLMLHHLSHVEAALQFDGRASEGKKDLVSALLM